MCGHSLDVVHELHHAVEGQLHALLHQRYKLLIHLAHLLRRLPVTRTTQHHGHALEEEGHEGPGNVGWLDVVVVSDVDQRAC